MSPCRPGKLKFHSMGEQEAGSQHIMCLGVYNAVTSVVPAGDLPLASHSDVKLSVLFYRH